MIVTDSGPSFVSEEFETFLRNNGIQHKKTPPYHLSSNGLPERAVQIFKRGMKKMRKGSLQDKISRFFLVQEHATRNYWFYSGTVIDG